MTQEIGELLRSGEDMGNNNTDHYGQRSTWSCGPQAELVATADPNNIGDLCPKTAVVGTSKSAKDPQALRPMVEDPSLKGKHTA